MKIPREIRFPHWENMLVEEDSCPTGIGISFRCCHRSNEQHSEKKRQGMDLSDRFLFRLLSSVSVISPWECFACNNKLGFMMPAFSGLVATTRYSE